MASANFQKIKTPQEAKAKMRHDEREKRLENNHTNKHIDKSMTKYNLDYFAKADGSPLTYEETCQRYDDIMEKLDSMPRANKRKDRVTNVCIEIPTPDDMTPEQEDKFFYLCGDILAEKYGEENLLQGYFHKDEQHEYRDFRTGEPKTSRNHGTFRFVPVVDGKLNAKKFTSRANIVDVNNQLEEMCQREFGIGFNNGKGKRGLSVEELKNASAKKEADLIRKGARKDADAILSDAKSEADEILDDAERMRSEAAESLGEALKARRAYEQAEEATQDYLDSMKDERSLTDWAQVKRLRSGKTIYDLYLSDTEAENKRKNEAFKKREAIRSRVARLNDAVDDMMQRNGGNDLSL